MKTQKPTLSATTRKRLEIQGYEGYSDEELREHLISIRFAYLTCGTIVAAGLIFQSPIILALAMIIAFFGIFPPYHPMDYVFNRIARYIDKPEAPERSNQGRFACGIATVCLGAIIFLFLKGHTVAANILGGLLLTQAIAVGTVDFCIPSMIYNFLFKRKKEAAV